MSPANKSSPTASGGKSKSSSSSGGRKPRRGGVRPIDFDASRYDNPTLKVFPVIPDHPDLTLALTPSTIPSSRFVCGVDHEKLHAAIKQAMYNIFSNSIAHVFELDDEVKSAFTDIVESLYSEKSIGADTFRFATKRNPATFFTFTALTKFIQSSTHDDDKNVLCVCPPALAELFWSIADPILMDAPSDDDIKEKLPFLSPSIRTAYAMYPNLPPDSPYKKFSQSCFMDPYGHWDSSILAYMAREVDPAEISDENSTPRGRRWRFPNPFSGGRRGNRNVDPVSSPPALL